MGRMLYALTKTTPSDEYWHKTLGIIPFLLKVVHSKDSVAFEHLAMELIIAISGPNSFNVFMTRFKQIIRLYIKIVTAGSIIFRQCIDIKNYE